MSDYNENLEKLDGFFWQLCYSPYLYPAYLAIHSSRVLEAFRSSAETTDEVATRWGYSKDALLALLPALLYWRFVRTTPSGRIIRRTANSPPKPGPWKAMIDRHLQDDKGLRDLVKQFLTVASGKRPAFWRETLSNSAKRERFQKSLTAHSSASSLRIVDEIGKRQVDDVVEIGGGYGATAIASLARSSRLSWTVLELPTVAADLRKIATKLANGRRLTVISGDARSRRWPKTNGVFLLSHFLQDFCSSDRDLILENSTKSTTTGGALWLHGLYWNANRPTAAEAAFSFYLFVRLGGFLLSVGDQSRQCSAWGWELAETIRTSPYHKLLIYTQGE